MQGRSTENMGGCPFSGAATVTDQRVSRRRVLAGAAGLATLPVLAGVGGTAVAAPSGPVAAPAPTQAVRGRARAMRGAHGIGDPRGSDIAVRFGRDREARFGVMFKRLPAFNPPDALLTALALRMNDGKQPLSDVKDSDVEFDNVSMPAGYIYFGQFIDHDMTRDKTPLTLQKQDPRGMVNYDTPKFDLGSLYGGGPAANPELYDPAKPGYMLVNFHDGVHDLPRDDVGAAYLGDPRNDENLIVAQLHVVFLRLHNKFRDQGKTFEQAQQLVRWHYQWLIVNDFLARIAGKNVVNSLLRRRGKGPIQFTGRLYQPRNPNRPYMPVEYAGAAYRFGHSMIRAEYEVQDGHTVPIFAPDGYEDLRGSRPIPENMWIDWNYFFDIPGMSTPDDRNMARLIDTQLSLPLFTLPSTVVAPTAGAIIALAERNLLRGKRLGLPAGQDVAVAMGIKPLSNAQLGLTEPGWKGKAPLWFYILKESELLGGTKLGPVGGRIVAEVILGLMALDRTSYFNRNPEFNPGGSFAMGDLILMADAIDERAREVKPEEPHPEEPHPEEPEAPEEPHPEEPEDEADPAALPEPASPTV
ncbi:peroxidase family protein [Pseudonocardia bannensis]|uniref:Peroxidase n=1 Tax=Pseudonocardia bannensis TaxID=630973 RepID=A0A848DNN2_9PSEU|nr:peroxidase family protein [Pseudonocardia bannensis]NMH93964.1 peroxidase [Pseudonocardia bannensis]